MKATDLMIGDWVLVQDDPNAGFRPCRVTIGLLHNLLISNETKRSVMPLRLTPEILEKNGYTHDKFAELALIAEGATRDTSVLISSDHRVLINNASHNINSFNKWFIHVDTEDMRSMAGFEITHVHELQHALKLCGIEKEIVL